MKSNIPRPKRKWRYQQFRVLGTLCFQPMEPKCTFKILISQITAEFFCCIKRFKSIPHVFFIFDSSNSVHLSCFLGELVISTVVNRMKILLANMLRHDDADDVTYNAASCSEPIPETKRVFNLIKWQKEYSNLR